MYIYKITNEINGKIYIGKTKIKGNESYYYGSGTYIKNAINKYGKEKFKKEILEYCDSVNELDEKEIFWIREYNSTNKEVGYNLTNGGDGLNIYGNKSEYEIKEIFKKLSEANKNAWVEKKERMNNKEWQRLKKNKSKIAKSYWNTLSDEERKKHIEKLKKGLSKVDFSKIQKIKWESYSKEKKDEIKKNIGRSNRDHWDSISKEKLEKIRDRMSSQTKRYWENISDEKLEDFKTKISNNSKNMWESFDDEKMEKINSKKSKSMKNLYKNKEYKKKHKDSILRSKGVKISIEDLKTGEIIIIQGRQEAANYVKCSLSTIKRFLKNEGEYKNKFKIKRYE